MFGRIWNFIFSTILMVRGKNVDPTSIVESDEFLQAIFEGSVSEVEQYLASGRDPNMRDLNNRTALQLAVESGSLVVLRMLLAHGASVNAVGFNGYTALHIAVHNSIDEIVQSGAQSGEEKTEILVCLLEAGAETTLTDRSGETPIGVAENCSSRKIVSLLKSYA